MFVCLFYYYFFCHSHFSFFFFLLFSLSAFFFPSAFFYPHFLIRIRHPQVSGPRFTDTRNETPNFQISTHLNPENSFSLHHIRGVSHPHLVNEKFCRYHNRCAERFNFAQVDRTSQTKGLLIPNKGMSSLCRLQEKISFPLCCHKKILFPLSPFPSL